MGVWSHYNQINGTKNFSLSLSFTVRSIKISGPFYPDLTKYPGDWRKGGQQGDKISVASTDQTKRQM